MGTLRKNMSEHSFTTMHKMYNRIIKYANFEEKQMSNTCSQLHMCNMYNTLMKYAHKQGRKKPKNHVSHFFTTICARCI